VKLGRRHLIASLVILGASIAWNVWVFTQPASRPANARSNQEPPLVTPSGSGPAAPVPIDPSAIPAPPPVDLSKEPAFTRNPFAQNAPSAPSPAALPSDPQPVAPEPVLGAIVFSSDRRSAVIDGRIVGVGDRIAGGVVIAIARDAVVIRRDSGGELRLEARAMAIRRESPQ
jgi:hypothetical protein